jgi:hypothetical protein
VKLAALLTLAALTAGAPALPAQTVVQPEPKLDATQLAVRASLYQLRDSLQLVEAASSRIARDRAGTSDASLRSRAQLMADRCRSAVSQLDSTSAVLERGKIPNPDPASALPTLHQALKVLRAHLVDCTGQFTALTAPAKAEELRGYGIGRGLKVQAAIQDYRPTATMYFRTVFQQQYWPTTRGAGATPSLPNQ